MRKAISLFLCLTLLLCGCGSTPAETVPETTIPNIIQEYESTVNSELGFSFPNARISVTEKDGKYSLSIDVVDFKNIESFPEYIFRVKDAFEKTIPTDCANYYSLWFIDPYSDHFVHFTSLNYETNPDGIEGIFKDSRRSDSTMYKIDSEEDWAIFFPSFIPENLSNTEVTEPDEANLLLESSTEPTTVPTTMPESEEPESTYVLNTNTRKFHHEWCNSAKKTKASNKSTFTGTREEIMAKGYDPCQNCNP